VRLRAWLLHQESNIATRWFQEIRAGGWSPGEEGGELLETLVTNLVSFIPTCFGEKREIGMEVWQEAARLYGSLGLRRGLAAGEVVEELQLLRNVILHLFLVDASLGSWEEGSTEALSPFDLLTLNRVLDLGVSGANVAYVDDLFFAHLQGSGVPGGITPELAEEMELQLEGFRRELGD